MAGKPGFIDCGHDGATAAPDDVPRVLAVDAAEEVWQLVGIVHQLGCLTAASAVLAKLASLPTLPAWALRLVLDARLRTVSARMRVRATVDALEGGGSCALCGRSRLLPTATGTAATS